MNKKHAITAGILLLLLAGVGWALYAGEDAELAEVKQLRDDMMRNRDSMSDEERRATRDAFRERAQNLSEDQRRELGRGFRAYAMQRIDRMLAMAPAERNQELDRLIDRMEEFRQNRGAGGGPGAGDRPRGDRGGNRTEAERDQRRKQRLDRSSPEMRAKMDKMKDLINERREQRGLEPIGGGGPMRGMFGGGPR